MNTAELLLIAVVLAIDAFTVALCIGVTEAKFRIKTALMVGLYFGIFQAFMPLVGFFAGEGLARVIVGYDHYLVFAIFVVLGAKMIYESFKKDCGEKKSACNHRALLMLAFATSIDAFAAGVSFAFAGVNIILAIAIIGLVAFAFSAIGVRLGGLVGGKFEKRAEFIGGIILVALAIYALVTV